MEEKKDKKRMPLHTKILLGLLLGATAGILVNMFIEGEEPSKRLEKFVSLVTEPIGKMWLSALIMVVIPLIISTLSLGVAGLGNIKNLWRIGLVTLSCFLVLTAISATFGLTAINVLKPGASLPSETKAKLMEAYKGQAEGAMGLSSNILSIDLLIKIVPRNPVEAAAKSDMLAIIFFSLILGLALTIVPKEKGKPILDFLESLSHVTIAIIELVMKVAPVGVFCLIFSVTARFGFHLLINLFNYVVIVIGTMFLFAVTVYPLVLFFVSGYDPIKFFRHVKIVIITAFSTSSSNATLPTTLRVAEEDMKIPRQVAGFVVPLGATMNMNGTSLFEGATVLFLAQVFGVDLSLGEQIIVVAMAVITAIGVAGIPGGSLPLIMMVLSMVRVPMEGIAIILGVDRLLDMCRTTINVSGDLVTATVVNRFSGLKNQEGNVPVENKVQ